MEWSGQWRRGTVVEPMDDLDQALRVIESFNRSGVEYAIFGGVALNLHGIVRATVDLDVFVRPEPEHRTPPPGPSRSLERSGNRRDHVGGSLR